MMLVTMTMLMMMMKMMSDFNDEPHGISLFCINTNVTTTMSLSYFCCDAKIFVTEKKNANHLVTENNN